MLELIPVVLTILAAAGYGTALARLHRRGDRRPASRTACLFAGSVCVCAAVLPPVSSHDEYFPVHIVQHLLLLGMAGPAFLALSAPVTLALRALPRRPHRAACGCCAAGLSGSCLRCLPQSSWTCSTRSSKLVVTTTRAASAAISAAST